MMVRLGDGAHNAGAVVAGSHCCDPCGFLVRACFGYTRRREAKIVENKTIDDISRRIDELIANTPVEDVQKNLRALLSAWFARLDLVTREEFDVQQAVLQRTREKLSQMEARVAELERSLGSGNEG